MPKAPWMLLCNPHSPQVVWPGRFITDRNNPQNYFERESRPFSEQSEVKIEALLIERLPKDNNLSLNLSSFASQFLSKGKTNIERLSSCQATRYLLVQADDWLDKLSVDESVQGWLEKRINRDKKKVWMITGVLTLTNTEVALSNSRTFGIGVGGSVPILAAAGLPIPLKILELGAEVGVSREVGHERSFRVPNEKVFEIQFTRVKPKRRKGDDKRFYLGSNPKWVPQWETRSSAPTADEDEDAMWESEEEETLEAIFDDDSDDEAPAWREGASQPLVWAQEIPEV